MLKPINMMRLKTTCQFVWEASSIFFTDAEDDSELGFMQCVGSWEGKWRTGRKGCVSTVRNDQHSGFRQLPVLFLFSHRLTKICVSKHIPLSSCFMQWSIYFENKNVKLLFYGPIFHSRVVIPMCLLFLLLNYWNSCLQLMFHFRSIPKSYKLPKPTLAKFPFG